MIYVEIFYLIEIILQFFTTYKDSEHFENVYTMRLIAKEYIINGSFILHVLAFIPWQLIIPYKFPEDGDINDPATYAQHLHDVERIQELLLFKMLRLLRMMYIQDSVTDDLFLQMMQNCYKSADRDERIAYDRQVINVFRILKSVLLTLIITYLLGLIWFRLSDFWQMSWFSDLWDPDATEIKTWVTENGLGFAIKSSSITT